MPRGNYTIQRSCEECGKIFTPPTLMSKYCCPTCSKRAYKKRQIGNYVYVPKSEIDKLYKSL